MNPKNFFFFIFSFVSFIVINLAPERISFCVICSLLLLVLYIKNNLIQKLNFKDILKSKISSHIFSLTVTLILGLMFFEKWSNDSSYITRFFNSLVVKDVVVSICTVVFSVAVYCFFIPPLNFINEKIGNSEFQNQKSLSPKKVSFPSLVIIFITSIVCITICSKSSPLYPFNDWYDANCFFTVGKSIANGKVLYRDIYEQKGPILYFLHTIFYYISPTTFIGGYILEIISCFSFLLISYKTLTIFASRKIIAIIPFFAAIVYSAYSFSHGGSAEEYCLPLLALSSYFGIKSVASGVRITKPQWFVIGVTSALVLWIKYTFLGFYIGFGIYFFVLYIKKKEMKDFFSSMVFLVSGIIVGSLPVIIYFFSNNGLSSLIEVYFHDNISLYSAKKSENLIVNLGKNLYSATIRGILYYGMCFVFITLGAIYLYGKKSSVTFYYLTTVALSVFFIFMGGRCHIYYPFILTASAPMGLLFVYHMASNMVKTIKFSDFNPYLKALCTFSYISFCLLIIFVQSPNTYLMKQKKEELPQYVFNEIIKETPNATLLNYGFLDGGFYTVSNITPNLKYFCTLNIKKDEMIEEQQRYIMQGLTDFVVTNQELPVWAKDSPYTVVSTSSFFFEGVTRTYYLYKKTSV